MLPNTEVTCGDSRCGFTWKGSSLFYLQVHWGSQKKNIHPVKHSVYLPSKPSSGLETGHFSPQALWASHSSNTYLQHMTYGAKTELFTKYLLAAGFLRTGG